MAGARALAAWAARQRLSMWSWRCRGYQAAVAAPHEGAVSLGGGAAAGAAAGTAPAAGAGAAAGSSGSWNWEYPWAILLMGPVGMALVDTAINAALKRWDP